MISLEEVRATAEEELREERFREAVEAYKEKLRKRRTPWDRVFPWKIVIIRKEDAQ